MEKKNIQYIRLLNFDDEANAIVNRAIQFSEQEKCGEIGVTHLFLALVEKTALGKDILEYLDLTFDMLFESYQILAKKGKYGRTNASIDHYSLDIMTQEMFVLLATVTSKMAIQSLVVTPSVLFNQLLESESESLSELLDYIGISIDDIRNMKTSRFSIPEQIADYVVDMNCETKKNEEYIYDLDEYTKTMIEVLSRKLEANPCLVGQAGVGKTTIVRGFVKRILSGNVPNDLKDTHVVYINSSLLTSNTRYRGEFEARMKFIIDWASASNVILFLDEIHTFINLGASAESSDTAGNMIKKALSDGDIKLIGATTTEEYHKYIEKDYAFARRLQVIDIKEPSVETAIDMISHTINNYESFHNVKITDECIKMAVELSSRYIKSSALPAKAYKILDQASTVVKLSGRKEVTEDDVLSTVSKITGVNVNKLGKSEAKQLINLEDTISKQLIGQSEAVETVCKAIRRSKAGVREENKPIASFLFVGPTGVGKTELCKVLSNEMAIGEASLIKVDMSELSEKHSTSKLIGTAPGYIGYGEGGQLTEKVKHNPYSIVLFDEIEKAHPEVFNIFLQLLDEGKLTDGEGRTVDFTNCIIIMTSNAGYGSDGMNKTSIGFDADHVDINDSKKKEKIALKALEETFRPEFLNRIDNVVIFEKLSKDNCKKICKLMLSKITNRLKNKNISLKFSDSIVNRVVELGYSDKYGARNIKREIQDTIEDSLSEAILDGTLYDGCKAVVSYKNNNISITVKS